MFSLLSTLTLLGALSAVSALAPTVALTFGWNDYAAVLVVTVVALVAAVFAPWTIFNFEFGGAFAGSEIESIRGQSKTRLCGLFGFVAPWFMMIVKFIGRIALSIAIIGYVLHEYTDALGVVVPIMATFYMWIAFLVLGAVRLDIEAAVWLWRKPWLATILQGLSLGAWLAAVVVLIIELIDLPVGVTVGWEIFLLIVSSVWVIVSFYYVLYYATIAVINSGDDETSSYKRTDGY